MLSLAVLAGNIPTITLLLYTASYYFVCSYSMETGFSSDTDFGEKPDTVSISSDEADELSPQAPKVRRKK